VLNSLSEEKLQASIRCLGKNGVFLEIGKYDIFNRTKIEMTHLIKGIEFKAVYFDDFRFTDMDELIVSKN
jgi:fatty acid synthase